MNTRIGRRPLIFFALVVYWKSYLPRMHPLSSPPPLLRPSKTHYNSNWCLIINALSMENRLANKIDKPRKCPPKLNLNPSNIKNQIYELLACPQKEQAVLSALFGISSSLPSESSSESDSSDSPLGTSFRSEFYLVSTADDNFGFRSFAIGNDLKDRFQYQQHGNSDSVSTSWNAPKDSAALSEQFVRDYAVDAQGS
ncbi:unnamed protein product [Fraxinus pennsylvanica]|uniref:Uncharacterized protein n=1 Tax=Fraxinus pennsylvanica TaxID=56036 RepID=A0AAD2DMN3_9LAMI|nr:unnamed protein product [Fraxinus pennsylvanica]